MGGPGPLRGRTGDIRGRDAGRKQSSGRVVETTVKL
jgi:hypothetical protein